MQKDSWISPPEFSRSIWLSVSICCEFVFTFRIEKEKEYTICLIKPAVKVSSMTFYPVNIVDLFSQLIISIRTHIWKYLYRLTVFLAQKRNAL